MRLNDVSQNMRLTLLERNCLILRILTQLIDAKQAKYENSYNQQFHGNNQFINFCCSAWQRKKMLHKSNTETVLLDSMVNI